MPSVKGLVLFSGGLDSILVVKIFQKEQIKVTGLHFVSYFFDNREQINKLAKNLKIKLKTVDFSEEHLKIVKDPRYGYGKAVNPCIDCHILMFKKAKEIMKAEGFNFIATGEVLGERPMSQNKKALALIEKKSGLEDYLLRPLSAKLLKPTIVEKKKLVNRDNLFDISGRSRKKQLALAKKWKIKNYPMPAGGCLLTDRQFAQRFQSLLKKWPDCQGDDVLLLKIGRHFWLDDNLILVGRDKEDNQKIEKLAQKGDLLIKPKDFSGPTILVRSKTRILKESLIKV